MRGYENCVWVCAVPCGGYRADAAALGAGRACGATVGRWRLCGGRGTRSGAGTSIIDGLGAGVVNGRVI